MAHQVTSKVAWRTGPEVVWPPARGGMMGLGPGADLLERQRRSARSLAEAPPRPLGREVLALPVPDLLGECPRPHVRQRHTPMFGQELGQRRVARQAPKSQRQRIIDRLPRLAGRIGHLAERVRGPTAGQTPWASWCAFGPGQNILHAKIGSDLGAAGRLRASVGAPPPSAGSAGRPSVFRATIAPPGSACDHRSLHNSPQSLAVASRPAKRSD